MKGHIEVAVDACSSPVLFRALSEMYSHKKFAFTHVNDIGGGEDHDWAKVFREKGGQVVFSGDITIARKPCQQKAFLDQGLICFFPKHPFQNLKMHQQSAYMIHNWKLIADQLRSGAISEPSCWQVPTTYRARNLTLSEIIFKKMEIPKEVLESAGSIKPKQ